METAYLSNKGRYTIFRYGDTELKIIAPYSLERYKKLVEWDNGYLVVMAKYSHNKDLEEEYIDLIPVLKELYMDEALRFCFTGSGCTYRPRQTQNTGFYQGKI